MKRFILMSLVVTAALLGGMSGTVQAAPYHGGHGAYGSRYGLHYGHGGYLYRDYRGWSSYYWNARYGCNWYFNPVARCYYYYYAPGTCYLPVTQIGAYPPTVTIVNNVPGPAGPPPVGPGPMMPSPTYASPGLPYAIPR